MRLTVWKFKNTCDILIPLGLSSYSFSFGITFPYMILSVPSLKQHEDSFVVHLYKNVLDTRMFLSVKIQLNILTI